MKIGILTFHNIPNIGAILQAYGLCQALRKQGYDCEIIDYKCQNIIDRELTYHPHRNLIKDVLLRIFWLKNKRKIKFCQQFMKNAHMYSNLCYTKETIQKANDLYDVFVSGSDMIWNLQVTSYDYTYFLDFLDVNKKRISYASSIGSIWENRDIENVRRFLSLYQGISVREEDTCNVIKSLGLECKHVVDPTMLLISEDWKKLASNISHKNYVLVYFPSIENLEAARSYAKRYNKKVVMLNWNIPWRNVINVSPYSPNQWLGYFLNAEAVFTNSYHGLLFALYFNKPVWTGNYGNRIQSLLTKFNLENCMLKNDQLLLTSIDYDICNNKIAKLREESIDYINNYLKWE